MSTHPVGLPRSPAGPTSGPPAPRACARCLADADVEIGGFWICLDCYHVAGSTCSGLGSPARPADPTC